MEDQEPTLLQQLDSVIPEPFAKFDAFPKLHSTYKSRSESRGVVTIVAIFIAFLLILNDLGEFVWGWPDYEFSVDNDTHNYLHINVDMMINMPCKYLSVDLRDAVGDRLYLSDAFLRTGTAFDIGQATKLRAHSQALSATQAIAESRKSRGFLSNVFRRTASLVRPTYKHTSHNSACRISGTIVVKKVTANLHITTLGHGYSSAGHVDHKYMNLSHVIEEFSFGPYFPEMTQPLDYSYETTHDPFIAYHYFIRVVPTTYIAPRSQPLHTNQYSVTHYSRVMEHGSEIPGIFFKFDLDPMRLSIHQRTTSFYQLLVRTIGVIGGVFVCMGYAIRITSRAVSIVSGINPHEGEIATASATGVKVGLRDKWMGGNLVSRSAKMPPPGGVWTTEGASSTYTGTTPLSAGFGPSIHSQYLSSPVPSYVDSRPQTGGLYPSTGGPYAPPPLLPSSLPTSPAPSAGISFPTAATVGSPYGRVSPVPYSPVPTYDHFPRTPTPGGGFPGTPGPPRSPVPPPPRSPVPAPPKSPAFGGGQMTPGASQSES